MQLFYCNPAEKDQEIWLSEEESLHCKVLRKQKNEILHLIDGQGGRYEAKILQAQKQFQILILNKTQENPRPYQIHLALAPTKNIDRMEWLVEKAVEIGVDIFSFFITEHSERKVLKLTRLEKIALSAAKQSLTAFLPTFNEIMPFDEFLAQDLSVFEKYIAYLGDDSSCPYLLSTLTANQSYLILIGAEGGFSPQEILQTTNLGFQKVSLGDKRLRTETAALVACHLCHIGQET